MKRLIAVLLLAALLFVGCAAQEQPLAPVEPDAYRLQAVNNTDCPIHGFGYAWYREDTLVLQGLCTAFDGGFVPVGELLAETFRLDSLGAGSYTLKLYVIDEDSAAYCAEPVSVTVFGGETVCLEFTGTKGAYSVQVSP